MIIVETADSRITGRERARARRSDPRPRVACILNVYTPRLSRRRFHEPSARRLSSERAWHGPGSRAVTSTSISFPRQRHGERSGERIRHTYLCSSVAEAIEGVDGVASSASTEITRELLAAISCTRESATSTRSSRHSSLRGRVLPLLNDKYFAYEWADAKAMADRVRDLTDSVSRADRRYRSSWQRPALDLPAAPKFDELLAVSYSDLEEHSLSRDRGTAVRSRTPRRDRCRARSATGRRSESGRSRRRFWMPRLPRRVNPPPEDKGQKPEAFEWEYRDGLRRLRS